MPRTAFGFLLIATFSFWVGVRADTMDRIEACREGGGRDTTQETIAKLLAQRERLRALVEKVEGGA